MADALSSISGDEVDEPQHEALIAVSLTSKLSKESRSVLKKISEQQKLNPRIRAIYDTLKRNDKFRDFYL